MGGGVFNWRFIHDQDKGRPAIKRRGTVAEVWLEACQWNAQGYGIFATVNHMDGSGYGADGQPLAAGVRTDTLAHVAGVRAHVVDLDNLNAMDNLQRAGMHLPMPGFYVQTSPGKAHVYWPLAAPYVDNDRYKTLQRKLLQLYEGDPSVVDATRVLRVPGFYHQKGVPHLVTVAALGGHGYLPTVEQLEASVAHVQVVAGNRGRHDLGYPELAAPSVDWLWTALDAMPIDGMGHAEFVKFTSAWKQAGWSIADPDEMLARWLAWCDRFGTESKGREYNLKQWNSIVDTEIGWKSLLHQNHVLNAQVMFKGVKSAPPVAGAGAIPTTTPTPGGVVNEGLLMPEDCMKYFEGCTFIASESKILTKHGEMRGRIAFNAVYGGPRFVYQPNGSPTDDAWKAATQSTFAKIPTASKLRFHPEFSYGEYIDDENRKTIGDSRKGTCGFNVFRKHYFEISDDQPTLFLEHIERLIPDETDRNHLFDYLAHNAKYPGHKIPWSPFVQSAEGAGKGVLKHILLYVAGPTQSHVPNAKELNGSGSKFNAWMRNKTMLVVDEVMTDDRRDLVETLKPFISEGSVEYQGKGADQTKGDNYANWAFFSNHKDAVP
ncbi:MAG: hypothetical protein DI498_06900, partial [Paracoccus denitrificans]